MRTTQILTKLLLFTVAAVSPLAQNIRSESKISAASALVTFYKDVLPILQKNCQNCHRPGHVAPMSFVTYANTRPWAKAMKAAVLTKKMPPWFADSHYGDFTNDPSLSTDEVDTLVKWVDEGAAAGNPKDAPPVQTFPDGWSIGKPDKIFDTGVDFKVPAKGKIEYTYFVVPTGFTEDKWVKDIEVQPGNKAVVHHIVLYTRPKRSNFIAEAKAGIPYVFPQNEGQRKDRPSQIDRATLDGIKAGYEISATYLPGGTSSETLPGQARLIPAGSDLIFQMHYTATGTEGIDRSRVGLVFVKDRPRERVINLAINNNSLRIPPGDSNHRVDGKLTLQDSVKLLALCPHMHLRGKSFQYTATLPNGQILILLKVPHYDFNWQLTYYLRRPIVLPAGTQLQVTAFYDNSVNNRFNPNPKQEVYWGDQSWDEMLSGLMSLAISPDRNPADLSWH